MRRLVPLLAVLGCDAPTAAPDAGDDPEPDAAPDPDAAPCADDGDDDGYVAAACGGPDCDDADPAVHPGAPDAAWASDTIGLANPYGAQVRADADGHWHVAWGNGGVWYAHDRAGAWQVEAVDPAITAGVDVTLALAPDGTPHVAYVDVGDDALHHAVRGGAGWIREVVDPTMWSGFQADVEVGAGGLVAIAHTRHVEGGADELRWSTKGDSGWTTEVVASDVRRHHGLAAALGPDDTAVLAWIRSGDGGLGVVTGGAGGWTAAVLPAHPFAEWGVDVAIGGDGAAAVVAGIEPTLLVRPADGSWSAVPLPEQGYHPRLALDPAGGVHVAVRGRAEGGEALLHLAPAGSGFSSEIVSTGGIFRPRIAVAPDGEIRILSTHPATGALRLHRDAPDDRDEDCSGD